MFEIYTEDHRALRPVVLQHFDRELQSIALGNWGPAAVTMDYDSPGGFAHMEHLPHSGAIYCDQLSGRSTEQVPWNLPGEIVGASGIRDRYLGDTELM